MASAARWLDLTAALFEISLWRRTVTIHADCDGQTQALFQRYTELGILNAHWKVDVSIQE
jgi:hypothetical protein